MSCERRRRKTARARGVALLLAVAALGAPASARPAPAAPGTRLPATLVQADDRAVTFRVDVPAPTFTASSLQGFDQIHIEGFDVTGDPAEPAVLSRPFLVAIPVGAAVSVTARVLASVDLGTHRLEPVPTPGMMPDDGNGFGPVTTERLVMDDKVYRAWSQPALVEADDPAFIRHNRVLPLRIHPVSYDVTTGDVSVATRVEVTVHITGGNMGNAPSAGVPAPPETQAWKEIFGRLVVNPAQGRDWRAPRPAMELESIQAPHAAVPGTVKISVRTTGMYKVTASTLINAGFPAGQPLSNLHLFKRTYDDASMTGGTADIAFTVIEDPAGTAGVFDGNDLLVFYGRRLRDDASQGDTIEIYSDHNVYWLEAAPGTMMATRAPGAGFVTADTTTASFPTKQHFEEDHVFNERTPYTYADPYVYSFWWAASPLDMPLDLNAVKPGTSLSLTARLIGYLTAVPPTLKLSIVNSTGEFVLSPFFPFFTGNTVKTLTATVPAANLVAGTNRFRMVRTDQANAQMSAMPNWVEATYQSLYRAHGNALDFNTGTLAGDTTVTVTGLSANTGFELFDVTSPTAPVRMTLGPGNFPAADGGYALSFRENIPSRRSFVLTPVATMKSVAAADVALDTPSSIMNDPARNGVDILVVANALFVPQMRQWASYRRAQGYRVLVVDVEDVFDEFNGGVPSPHAIYRFTRYFYEHGNAGALVLVGDSSEDEKNVVTGFSAPNFMPSYLRMFHVTTNPADDEVVTTDKPFVMMPGPGGTIDRYPDLIVGRLPVGSTGELKIVLDKIFKYEAPTASDFWRKRMVLVADDTHSEGGQSVFGSIACLSNVPQESGFQTGQEQTAQTMLNSLPAGYDIHRFYLKQYTDAFYPPTGCTDEFAAISFTRNNVTDLLLNELNQGATLVTIQAHMNRYTVCHERLLTTESGNVFGTATGRDHLRVDNRGKPWILFAMGCHFSDYAFWREAESGTVSQNSPNGDSFGEQFLFQNDRGAVATYGSTGFEYLGDNNDYMNRTIQVWFYDAPFDTMLNQTQAEWKLGQLMFLTEAQMVTASSRQADSVERYELLGDPMLRIDAGPPAFDVTVDGRPVKTGDTVESGGEGDTIQVQAVVTDENAIHAFDLHIDGVDETDSLTIVPLVDQQLPRARQYRVSFRHKLKPANYDIVLRAYQAPDTLAGKYHIAAEFVLKVQSSITVSVNGRAVESGAAVPARGSYRVDLALPVFVPASQIAVSLDDTPIADVTMTHPSPEDSLKWTLTFQRSLAGGKHKLHVQAGGTNFDYILIVSETAGLRNVINYPNPFQDKGTTFLYTNDVEILDGSIDIFTVSGKRVRNLPIPPGSRLPGENSVFWDGRDGAGDRLANGVYLYVIRVAQRGGSATVRGKVSHIE